MSMPCAYKSFDLCNDARSHKMSMVTSHKKAGMCLERSRRQSRPDRHDDHDGNGDQHDGHDLLHGDNGDLGHDLCDDDNNDLGHDGEVIIIMTMLLTMTIMMAMIKNLQCESPSTRGRHKNGCVSRVESRNCQLVDVVGMAWEYHHCQCIYISLL